MPLSQPRAQALAADLDVSLDGVCLACLSFVAMPLDRGDTAEVRRWTRRMTPDLWSDGLDLKILTALRFAIERGVPDAGEALTELESLGPRSAVARAVVLRLAEDLVRWERRDRAARLN